MKTHILTAACLMAALAPCARGAVLGQYAFTGNSLAASSAPSGATLGNVVRGPGAIANSGQNNLRTFGLNGASITAAVTNGDFVGLTIAPVAGYDVSLANFFYDYSQQAGGSPVAVLQSSKAGFGQGKAIGTLAVGTGRSLSLASIGAISAPVEFRIYGFGANSTSVMQTLDNLTVGGSTLARASLNAQLEAPAAQRVFTGATGIGYRVQVTNDALAAGTAGTQALDYQLDLSGATGISAAGGSPAALASGATNTIDLVVDTSTAGAKGGALGVASQSAWRANGLAGSAAVSFDLGSVSVFDRSNASFAAADSDVLTLDFGTITAGFGELAQAFSLHNLEATAGFTAGLDLDSIVASGDTSIFSTGLGAFGNLAAGGSESYIAKINDFGPGSYAAEYVLDFSDEDSIAGDEATQSLTLRLTANVVARPPLSSSAAETPEPSTAALLGLGVAALAALARKSRRRAA